MTTSKSVRAKRTAKPAKRRPHEEPAPTVEVESEQAVPSPSSVADAAREKMIAEAAYYRAEKRGFAPGREIDDWLAAEAEISGCFLRREPTPAELH